MKQYLPTIIWFSTGAVLGQFTESVLSPLWIGFGLLIPLGRWLDSFGNKSLEWCWFIINIWLMSWLVIGLVSVIGALFIKHRFLMNILLFGAGFAFVPLVLHAYLCSRIPTLADYVQHVIIIGIAVVCGLLCHRFQSGHANRAA
jgi:hypothetical protein